MRKADTNRKTQYNNKINNNCIFNSQQAMLHTRCVRLPAGR